MQYLITPLLEVLNPTNTVSRNRLLSFAIGNMEAEIYNCLIAKHVYYNNQGKLHEGGWFYSTVKDLHLSSGYAEDAQKTAMKMAKQMREIASSYASPSEEIIAEVLCGTYGEDEKPKEKGEKVTIPKATYSRYLGGYSKKEANLIIEKALAYYFENNEEETA